MNEASTFQDSIEDGSCQVLVVQHFSPLTEGLVGSKDHRAFFEIAIIHHMEQNIGGVGAIAKIPDFIDKCSAEHLSINVKLSVMWSRRAGVS